jgi:acyl-coenzyme A thioesterase PaaI-like protein
MSLAGNKDPRCYVCGLDNPVGLRVRFAPYGVLGSRACYTARAVHAGWDGILHGGVILALMDEALRWSLYFQNIVAVTARVETRFHPPIPVGTSLIVTARVIKQRRRLFEAHAEIWVDGSANTLLAEAAAVMCASWPGTRGTRNLRGGSIGHDRIVSCYHWASGDSAGL